MKATLFLLSFVIAVSGATAQQPDATPPLLENVLACRAQADEQTRLRCFDAAVGALATASQSGGLMVIDRDEMRQSRRSLFGFSLPNLPFFRGDTSQEDAANEIESTVRSVRGAGYGKWVITLAEGATWQTTEAAAHLPAPAAGQKIRIKKGPLGNYMLSINGRRSVRAMRIG